MGSTLDIVRGTTRIKKQKLSVACVCNCSVGWPSARLLQKDPKPETSLGRLRGEIQPYPGVQTKARLG